MLPMQLAMRSTFASIVNVVVADARVVVVVSVVVIRVVAMQSRIVRVVVN